MQALHEACLDRGNEVQAAYPEYTLTPCGWYVDPDGAFTSQEFWWQLRGPLVTANEEGDYSEDASEALSSFVGQLGIFMLPFDTIMFQEYEGEEKGYYPYDVEESVRERVASRVKAAVHPLVLEQQ